MNAEGAKRLLEAIFLKPIEGEVTPEIELALDQVLGTIDVREQEVIGFRFGLFGEPLTLREMGRLFDLTPERIRQIQNKALRRLRHPTRTRLLKQTGIATTMRERRDS